MKKVVKKWKEKKHTASSSLPTAQEGRPVQVRISLLENNKILLSEKTAQRNALKDNAEIPVNEIEKALQDSKVSDTIESIEVKINKSQKQKKKVKLYLRKKCMYLQFFVQVFF